MTGDFKLSLDIFNKKKREVSGIDNPNMVIEEGQGVSEETGKTEGPVNTLEVSLCTDTLYFIPNCLSLADAGDSGER